MTVRTFSNTSGVTRGWWRAGVFGAVGVGDDAEVVPVCEHGILRPPPPRHPHHHGAADTAAAVVARADRYRRFAGIQPDGHGIWAHTQNGTETTTGSFLECDTGTEPIGRLISKLDGYARLAASGGPRYPVLFWLPSSLREKHLRRILSESPPLRGVLVATATHDSNPGERVWLPVTATIRHRLQQLPSHHGPHSAANPNWSGGHLDLTDQHPRPVHLR